MPRDEAKEIDRDFHDRLRGDRTVTIPSDDAVRLREAWLTLDGAHPDEIRRTLEEEWGTPLD